MQSSSRRLAPAAGRATAAAAPRRRRRALLSHRVVRQSNQQLRLRSRDHARLRRRRRGRRLPVHPSTHTLRLRRRPSLSPPRVRRAARRRPPPVPARRCRLCHRRARLFHRRAGARRVTRTQSRTTRWARVRLALHCILVPFPSSRAQPSASSLPWATTPQPRLRRSRICSLPTSLRRCRRGRTQRSSDGAQSGNRK